MKGYRFFCQINANLSVVTYKFAKCQMQRTESELAATLTTSVVIIRTFSAERNRCYRFSSLACHEEIQVILISVDDL